MKDWRKYRAVYGPNVIEYGGAEVVGKHSVMLMGVERMKPTKRATMSLEPASAALLGTGVALTGSVGGAFLGGYVARRNKWYGVVIGSIAGSILGGLVGSFAGGAIAAATVDVPETTE